MPAKSSTTQPARCEGGDRVIKHMLLWRFRPEVSETTKAALIDELNTFPAEFPQMHNWTLGENVSERDNTFTHAFVIDFDSVTDLNEYLHSSRHEEFVANRWRQHVAQRAIMSYTYDATPGESGRGEGR